MVEKLMNRINKPITYVILAALVILLLVVPDFTKAPIGPYAFREHANGYPLLDTKMNYNPHEAYHLLGNYGPDGRGYYVLQSLSLDVVIPFSLMLLIELLLYQIYRRTAFKKHILILMVIPFIGFLCDYAENVSIITMIAEYPQKAYGLAYLSNIFTLGKSVFCTLGIGEIIIGFIYMALTGIFRKIASDKHNNKMG